MSSKFRKGLLLLASASSLSAAHTPFSGGSSESAASLGGSRRYRDRPWPLNLWHWEQMYLSPRGPGGQLCHILMEREREGKAHWEKKWFSSEKSMIYSVSNVLLLSADRIHTFHPFFWKLLWNTAEFLSHFKGPIWLNHFNTTNTYSAVSLNKRNLIWPISWVLVPYLASPKQSAYGPVTRSEDIVSTKPLNPAGNVLLITGHPEHRCFERISVFFFGMIRHHLA